MRVDGASPRELGIHNAYPDDDGLGGLPAYVSREFDFRLRNALTAGPAERGTFVVAVGASAAGKSRSLYEAILELVPDWPLVQPADAAELLASRHLPPRSTVYWLDELQLYLGGSPALTAECVRALLRHGNIVVGTLWPEEYAKWTAERDEAYRVMRSAVLISVPDMLSSGERRQAIALADEDDRIRQALNATETGFTQALAGGHALMMSWQQPATAYTRAIIAAAADAHRLGVQAPIGETLLARATYGYFEPKSRHRTRPEHEWLPAALSYATRELDGDVQALRPADDGRPGTVAGYVIADYLAQHLRRERRTALVPDETWLALIEGLSRPADLRRVAHAATVRMRYGYTERALARLATEFGDGRAAVELADLLIRQDRFAEVFELLRGRLTADPGDRLAGRKYEHARNLAGRVTGLRPPPGPPEHGIPEAVADILADGGVCEDLRAEAARGDRRAAERLVERLADRGCLADLRDLADRDHPFAADALADLYVAWGDAGPLRERAARGDRAAQLRLTKVAPRTDGASAEIAELRGEVDEGRPAAAFQLCTLLFELRDDANLRAEVDAGTAGAAERLVALRTADEGHPRSQLIRLRAYGLTADGNLATHLTGREF